MNGCGRPERTRMLENVYNELWFNRIHPREYDGSYLTFPGISADIDLYPHQRKAGSRRILQSGGGHTRRARLVERAKTFTGVKPPATRRKQTRPGHKPMIVVPNHLTENNGRRTI